MPLTDDKLDVKILKGNIIFTPELGKFSMHEDSYIIVENNKVKSICKTLPAEYKNFEVDDYGNKLIIPGFVDLHFHAPQYANRGLGLDKELLPWLEDYTFPEEAKFADVDYAKKIYKRVVKEVWKQGTTRIVVFGSLHKESTKILLDYFIKSGLGAFVGKVGMDRNSPDYLIEETEHSLAHTEEILKEYANKSDIVKPIITPRFVPTCTPESMGGFGELAKKYNVPIQSHLSENTGEVEWVKELHPEFDNYASVYHSFGCFGQLPTVMAHCVHNIDEEIDLMSDTGVYAAHCPNANYNLSSGIMPVRKFLNKGCKVGLGTDVGAGHKVSIANVMSIAIQASKIKWLESDKALDPITTEEAFYLGTKGGGSFFGKVGSFEEGYDFDALVIDDSYLGDTDLSLRERLQRYIYIGDDRNIVDRYVAGKKVDEPVLD
ncbi:guanine deaminase [Dethiothermospora halolimnae]|uniref:guanine deaminase n=1 Tax=Dethiothermospora halolimnae TaxID=3114390 RepID=UPI003CCB7C32